MVPYEVDSAFPVFGSAYNQIMAAIRHWRDFTIINLVPRSTETNYIRFISAAGKVAQARCACAVNGSHCCDCADSCYSFVGMTGGAQSIGLDPQGKCGLGSSVSLLLVARCFWCFNADQVLAGT